MNRDKHGDTWNNSGVILWLFIAFVMLAVFFWISVSWFATCNINPVKLTSGVEICEITRNLLSF